MQAVWEIWLSAYKVMSELKAVILAAGQGTRMKSKLPKVVHKVLGKCMVRYAINAAKEAGATKICVVVGHGADTVKSMIDEDVVFVTQDKQLGTGHAVKCARDFIGKTGETLILFGDTPLITGATLKTLVDTHRNSGNAITVLSASIDNPTGYGRIIRDKDGQFVKSVEHKDATDEERLCKEVNSGMYVFDSGELYEALDLIKNDNAQGEYYLPDTLMIIKDKGLKVDAFVAPDAREIEGVNSRVQLAYANKVMKERINNAHMVNGVTITDPENTYIECTVTIENDVTLYPNTFLEGNTVIKSGSVIGPCTRLKDTKAGVDCTLAFVTADGADIPDATVAEPYSKL